jgi:hypothetical protein
MKTYIQVRVLAQINGGFWQLWGEGNKRTRRPEQVSYVTEDSKALQEKGPQIDGYCRTESMNIDGWNY